MPTSNHAVQSVKCERSIISDNNFWVAASDYNGGEIGEFMWPDKSLVDARMWADGYPQEHNNVHTCVAFYTGDINVRNHRCLDRRFYLCQVYSDVGSCL
jgi:hypothetical protein